MREVQKKEMICKLCKMSSAYRVQIFNNVGVRISAIQSYINERIENKCHFCTVNPDV